MKTLIVGHEDVKRLLPMSECINVMDDLFKSLARGEAVVPLRQVMVQQDKKGRFVVMPACLASPRAIGGKFITVFNGNRDTAFESHQGAVLLSECGNGRLLAIEDATTITNIRTAAASGAATRALARKNAHDLAILGSGTEASTHLAAMRAVRDIGRVRVWSRNIEHARRFAEAKGTKDLPVEVASSAEEAVSKADLICTTTAAASPILRGEWISPGVHINAIGASIPGYRELDSRMMAMSMLYTDWRESLFNEGDDFRIPLREGSIKEDHLRGELGEVLVGKIAGRTSDSDVTLFKSQGLAAEDLAAAYYVYVKAEERRLGTWVDFSGERELQNLGVG
jgi:ornithine cyclodeaminase